MSYLSDALDATHPGHSIDVTAVEDWLLDHDIKLPAENWEKRQRVEREAYRAAEKAARDAQFAAAPIYTGAITDCMANDTPGRGAPYRCRKQGRLRIVRSTHTQKPLAVCSRHARDLTVSEYTGWAGNPNPPLDTLEPEQVEKLS